MSLHTRLLRLLAALTLIGLVASGCGSDSSGSDNDSSSSQSSDSASSADSNESSAEGDSNEGDSDTNISIGDAKDFPEDLPLPDLKPTTTFNVGKSAWGFVYTGATRDQFEAFQDKLADADFERQGIAGEDENGQFYVRDNVSYTVVYVDTPSSPNAGLNVNVRVD